MKIQNDISILTERLARINESLARKIQMRNDFDKTIAETEGAYNKASNVITLRSDIDSLHSTQILESSQTLLHVLKRETGNLKEKVEDIKTHTAHS